MARTTNPHPPSLSVSSTAAWNFSTLFTFLSLENGKILSLFYFCKKNLQIFFPLLFILLDDAEFDDALG